MKTDPPPVLVTAAEMRTLEEQTFATGVSADALMEEAGAGLAAAVAQFHPVPGSAILFTGKGHNAGDTFVLARLLTDSGWRVQVRHAWPEADLRPLALAKWQAVRDRVSTAAPGCPDIPPGPLLLVDGLLGTGSSGPLTGPARAACQALNALRLRTHGTTLAIDIPSGLDGADGPDPDTVVADLTVTLGYPKTNLVSAEAAAFTGRLLHVPLAAVAPPADSAARDLLVTPPLLRPWLPAPPPFSRHKGQNGRIGILAGSRGLTGAARLCSTAAVLAGGGLVTLFCPADIYDILAAACPPEVMVRPVRSADEILTVPLDVLAAGPGLGAVPLPNLAALLLHDPRPLVVDADALNALANLPAGTVPSFAGPRLLTPHPGELARLIARWIPERTGHPGPEQARAIADAWSCTVAAKSARTAVIARGQPALWNSTGHPLMARGGMGDVLTGFAATLTARGLTLRQAAAMGSWLIGYGAEHWHAATGHTEPGTPSRLMEHAAGAGFAALRRAVIR